MTLRYIYNGIELADTTTRIRGANPTIAQRADGTYTTGSATLRDPTGTLTYLNLQTFAVVEDLCVDAPVLHYGLINNLKASRGDYTTGAGRVWTFDFTDINYLLHMRVLRGLAAKRSSEDGDARMAWLLGTLGMSGVVHDNGMIAANPWVFDESDYRGKYADEVLPDLCVSSVTDVGRIFFVYYDQDALEPALFMDAPGASTNACTLRISNVPADYDGVTTFDLAPGSEIEIQGDDVYDGVYFSTKNGSIYRQRPATYTAYGVHRDGTFTTDRIALGATAERHAQAWLAHHSQPVTKITCTVRLPRELVGLMAAGMRISVRFEELPGYSAFTWSRITAREISIPEGLLTHYDVKLELSVRGLSPAGGGNPGDYPKPPAPAANYYEGSGVFELPSGTGGWFWAADPDAVAGSSTVTSTNKAGAAFQPGVTYDYEVDYVGEPGDVAIAFALDSAPVYPPNGAASGFVFVGTSGTGSFTVPGGGGLMQLSAKAQLGGAGPGHLATVTWRFNPVGWVTPVDDGPLPGQEVPPAPPQETPDGVLTTFTTAWAYAAGSLHVEFNGSRLEPGIDFEETDPSAGTFTFLTFTPSANAQIVVWYEGA